MLHGVSVLELCLVIAMKHVRQIYDDEPFNFEMVFRGMDQNIWKQHHLTVSSSETIATFQTKIKTFVWNPTLNVDLSYAPMVTVVCPHLWLNLMILYELSRI